MELWQVLLIFIAGAISGVINTLAGGGALLAVPLLILLGMPANMANGTYRVSVWVQCIASAWQFRRLGMRHLTYSFKLSAPAVVGAIVGAQLAVDISAELFERIFAIVMVLVVGIIIWNPRPRNGATAHLRVSARPWLTTLTFFLIGVYGGMIQAGVGYFLTAALVFLCGLDLLTSTSVKVVVIAVYTTFALVVFIWNGQVDWPIALILSVGNALGGWFGAQIAVAKGEAWIRWALAITAIVLASKMLGVLPI